MAPTAAVAAKPVSPVTAAANLFVSEHLAQAAALGAELAELVANPGELVAALEAGLVGIADPLVVDGIARIAPGIGQVAGIRLPLLEAVHKAYKKGTRKSSTVELLGVVDLMLGQTLNEIRWLGIWDFERLLATDPGRTWQLMRRAAAGAGEWITVDTLAHPYGAGIIRDETRWAELEQLLASESRWERRLVGSTLATLPHVKLLGARDPINVGRGLTLIEQLIGDNEPDVQKALSWALRNFAELDPQATASFLEAEAETARRNNDGNRAWVIRDSLSKMPSDTAASLRTALEGIRRESGGQSTSRAAAASTATTTGAVTTARSKTRED